MDGCVIDINILDGYADLRPLTTKTEQTIQSLMLTQFDRFKSYFFASILNGFVVRFTLD